MLFQLIVLLKPTEDTRNNYSHLERQAGKNYSDMQNSISFHKKNQKNPVIPAGLCNLNPKIHLSGPRKGQSRRCQSWDMTPTRAQRCLGWEAVHPAILPWDFPAIIQHTHGKTNPLLAWISIQGMIFVTENMGNRAWWHLSLCCLLIFPSHKANPGSSLLQRAGSRQDGKEVTLPAPACFCVLLSQIPGARQEILNKLDIKNWNAWRNLSAFTRAQQSKQCRDAKYFSWAVSAGCELQHLSLSRFLLFLIRVQPHFFMPRNLPDDIHPTLCVLKRQETPNVPRVTCQASLLQALGFALEVLQFSFLWGKDFHKYV